MKMGDEMRNEMSVEMRDEMRDGDWDGNGNGKWRCIYDINYFPGESSQSNLLE